MYENNNRRRPHLDDARPRDGENRGGGFFFTGFQVGVCVICLLVAVGLKQFGGVYYKTAQAYVKNALQKSITGGEVTQAMHTIRNQVFPDAAEVFSNGVTSSQPGSPSKTDASSVKSGGGSLSSSSKPSSKPSASSAATAPQGPVLPPASLPSLKLTAPTSVLSGSHVALTGRKAQPSPLAVFPALASPDKTAGLDLTAKNAVTAAGGKDLPVVDENAAGDFRLPPATASFAPYKLTMMPVTPVSGRLTSAYGYRINPVTGVYGFHTGMDIAAPGGTPVAAAFGGEIAEVGISADYGNYVLLDSGGGIKTFYGHCSKVNVKKGDRVAAGQTIALVGSTGMSTGDHLHFELRIHNIYENPQWAV